MGQDGHIDLGIFSQHTQSGEADAVQVHHNGIGAGSDGGSGIALQVGDLVSDIDGVDGLLTLDGIGLS